MTPTRADQIDAGAESIKHFVNTLLSPEAKSDFMNVLRRISASVLLAAKPSSSNLISSLTDRLRGKYILTVDDGGGLLNGKDTFTRAITTPPIQQEAAQVIDDLAHALKEIVEKHPDTSCMEKANAVLVKYGL